MGGGVGRVREGGLGGCAQGLGHVGWGVCEGAVDTAQSVGSGEFEPRIALRLLGLTEQKGDN